MFGLKFTENNLNSKQVSFIHLLVDVKPRNWQSPCTNNLLKLQGKIMRTLKTQVKFKMPVMFINNKPLWGKSLDDTTLPGWNV